MHTELKRRELLIALGAVGIAQSLRLPGASAQDTSKTLISAATASTKRIDVHHHILPPDYVRIVGRTAIGAPSPNKDVPTWTVQDSLNVMDQYGVTTAIVSLSTPGVWFKDKRRAQRVARVCNNFAAQMTTDYPTRFGFFATMPLPDINASLAEIRYCMEDLHCDGIGLMTNYGDRYLGDAHFGSLFDELNRRAAVVYVHPTSCACDRDVLPEIPAGMIEFPHNTTRTIVSLLFSGAFARYPNIRFIFSHAGGTLPAIVSRIAGVGAADKQLATQIPNGVMPLLQKLYYDTASAANPFVLPSLLKLVSAKNVLLGTDFPFSAAGVQLSLEGLRSLNLSKEELEAIEGKNATAFFPRFNA